MRTIIHSTDKTAGTDIISYSYAIKLCYLLADEVVVLGDIQFLISYIQLIQRTPFEIKVKVMHEGFKAKSPEFLFITEQYLSTLKNYNKVKNPAPNLVTALARLKHSLSAILKGFVEHKIKNIQRIGFSELGGLLEKDVLGCCNVKEDEKVFLHKKNELVSLQDLICLKLSDKNTDINMLVLNDLLYKKEVVKNNVFTSPLAGNVTNTNCSYLYRVAALPDLQLLSQNELKTIRLQFKGANKDFRLLIDQWLVLCNTAEDKTAGVKFFVKQIIPLIPSFSTTLQTQPVLESLYNHNKNNNQYLFMGEITKTVLLNYYKEYEYLTTDKYNELFSIYSQNNQLDRRIPVMFISVNKELKLSKISLSDTTDDESLLMMRKFINPE